MLREITGDVIYTIILVLLAANVFAAFIGVLLLAVPHRVTAWLQSVDSRINMRRLTKPLDIMRDTDAVFFRYARLLGAVILAASAFILIRGGLLVAQVQASEGGRALARLFDAAQLPSNLWETLWVSLVIFMMLATVLALIVGTLMVFDVGLARKLSEVANRWLSTRQAIKSIDTPYQGLDHAIRAHPRLWGGIITAVALYVSGVLLWFSGAG